VKRLIAIAVLCLVMVAGAVGCKDKNTGPTGPAGGSPASPPK
jgi:hypothetical protein